MKRSRHPKAPPVMEGQAVPTSGDTPELCDICKQGPGPLQTVRITGTERKRACASCVRAILRRRSMARRRQ